MKAQAMEGTPAVVLTHDQLKYMLEEAGKTAAELTVQKMQEQLLQDPNEKLLLTLREYIANPNSMEKPREQWAHSAIIREVALTPKGKPKSVAWFMKFQKETGLNHCPTQRNASNGPRKCWCFEDIRNAWQIYYQ